ncbi:hypothetical protein JZ751_016733 [Albula glossodonta]|uniref:RRM domain-containing protein n=1 Tax=Albula glossodonta TaxID=121402 RepID=A0A8T2NT11_9TELE|nr:hypothetical protein JZ751_016733 [Albula glossodonta]
MSGLVVILGQLCRGPQIHQCCGRLSDSLFLEVDVWITGPTGTAMPRLSERGLQVPVPGGTLMRLAVGGGVGGRGFTVAVAPAVGCRELDVRASRGSKLKNGQGGPLPPIHWLLSDMSLRLFKMSVDTFALRFGSFCRRWIASVQSNGTGKMNGSLEDVDQPDPDSIKMFVGQIPRSWSETELKELFEPYGAVYQINILRDRSQNPPQSKGSGICRGVSPGGPWIRARCGTMRLDLNVVGRRLKDVSAGLKLIYPGASEHTAPEKPFFALLPCHANHRTGSLHSLIREINFIKGCDGCQGSNANAVIIAVGERGPRRPAPRKPRRFCVHSMHHPIQMKPADSEKSNAVEDRKLFIGMVSKKCNENDIRVMFSPFGQIEESRILRGPDGLSRVNMQGE